MSGEDPLPDRVAARSLPLPGTGTGVPDDLEARLLDSSQFVRTVTENSRTLKFESLGSEEE